MNIKSDAGTRIVPIVVLSFTPAAGQDFRATLTGRVVDPSDAHIRGAVITVTNFGTNAVTPRGDGGRVAK